MCSPRVLIFIFFHILAAVFLISADLSEVHVCDASNSNNSYIYCSGRLLDAVNNLSLFDDSKEFVDMPLVYSPNETIMAFDQQFPPNEPITDKAKLQTFLDDYFRPPGSELQNCTPTDWIPYPPKLTAIVDPDLRAWALELNAIWKDLCRQIDTRIRDDHEKYSLIYVPEPFIVPGGRFREFYYWDAYWIIKGLLASNMTSTTRSMITNLVNMVDRFGFVPNGGRVYYLQRSQPPLLAAMVYEYYEKTKDKDFIIKVLPTLLKEFNFWQTSRTVNVTLANSNGNGTYTVYRYATPSTVPRPEAYQQDKQNAQSMDEQQQRSFYQNMASAAESGWDFSSRWFADKFTLQKIETTQIIPIDLNAFMCWNMDILQYLSEQMGDTEQSNNFLQLRATFRLTLNAVFYNATKGAWFDYNMRTGMQNVEFYPHMAVPLFTGCYQSLNQWKAIRVFQYMTDVGAFAYPGGVPTSLVNNTGEQWDFPNGWSPLNHMVIEGLRKSSNPDMQDQAFRIAEKWIQGNYRVFDATKHMYEKYNVIGTVPEPGAGGEYEVQQGFGWTNGVILDLLVTYGDRLRLSDATSAATTAAQSQPGSAATTRPICALLVFSMTLLFRSYLCIR
uniref:Trehalase n=1 Tax=Plectus sambesii TaxID=2011161 RepID=A0A914WWR6_9BILA